MNDQYLKQITDAVSQILDTKIGAFTLLSFKTLEEYKNTVEEKMSTLTSKVDELTAQLSTLGKENNILRDRITSSSNQGSNLMSPSLLAASNGLFYPQVHLGRNIPLKGTLDKRKSASGKESTRKDVFAWKNYRDLVDRVRFSEASIDDETWEACKDNCTAKIIRSIILDVKSDPVSVYDVNNETRFTQAGARVQTMAIWRLEEIPTPHLPLKACIGNWGAELLLEHFWLDAEAKKTIKGKTNPVIIVRFKGSPFTSDGFRQN